MPPFVPSAEARFPVYAHPTIPDVHALDLDGNGAIGCPADGFFVHRPLTSAAADFGTFTPDVMRQICTTASSRWRKTDWFRPGSSDPVVRIVCAPPPTTDFFLASVAAVIGSVGAVVALALLSVAYVHLHSAGTMALLAAGVGATAVSTGREVDPHLLRFARNPARGLPLGIAGALLAVTAAGVSVVWAHSESSRSRGEAAASTCYQP